jgi:hypothetical protein
LGLPQHGEYNGKSAEEFVKHCVLEQFYCHDAVYRAAITAADIGGNEH